MSQASNRQPPFSKPKRTGFTLVEMLVSMALILFVMVLLSTAFTTGLQVFRQLKGLGDMEEHLRSTAQILRRDLIAYHFENYRKLSDPTFWSDGPPQQGFFRIWQGSSAVSEGLDGDSIPSFRNTGDMLHFTCKLAGQGQGDFATSTLPANVSAQTSAALLVANGADSRYQQSGQFRGRWFEVVYFLRPNGLSANGTGVPLFTLYRRQLGVMDTTGTNPPLANQLNALSPQVSVAKGTEWASFSEISCKKSGDMFSVKPAVSTTYPDTVRFNSPADLTMPARRFGMLPAAAGATAAELAGVPADRLLSVADGINLKYPIISRTYPFLGEIPADQGWPLPQAQSGPLLFGIAPVWQANPGIQGADLLLSDVISFDVKALVSGASDFADISALGASNNNVLSNSATSPAVFDTWSTRSDGTYDYSSSMTNANQPTSVPLQANIQALKITIRIWDAKTLQARQITIIQDM